MHVVVSTHGDDDEMIFHFCIFCHRPVSNVSKSGIRSCIQQNLKIIYEFSGGLNERKQQPKTHQCVCTK